MSVRKRRSYHAEFKKNAVLLTEDPDRAAADVADSLAIPKDMLYRWRRALSVQGKIAFPGRGNEALTDEQRDLKELQKRLQHAEMECDILKKAFLDSIDLRKRILAIYNEYNGMIRSPLLTSNLRDELLFQTFSQNSVARHRRVL